MTFNRPVDIRTLASDMIYRGERPSRKDERSYILLSEIEFYVEFEGMDEVLTIEIPRGFVTDLASVPRVAWPLIGPSGSHAPAAILHDWLYRADVPFSRRTADLYFRYAMDVSGVPAVRKWILWAGVRLPVGAWVWRKNKRREPIVLPV